MTCSHFPQVWLLAAGDAGVSSYADLAVASSTVL